MDKFRVIAINLPQYHPFKENDEWWGKGFTEWTNVTKARPRFKGHYEPHLPADTGFYDLRLPEARQMQADLAKDAGIYGFCYYHYWFNGHQLMERPVNEILSSGEPDFPFMLCWANENWARNWDGGFKNVLIEQKYSKEDDINHMRWLCEKVFPDKRYIKVDGKPVFVVYRPALFPDIQDTILTWRTVAKDYGYDLYLAFMLNWPEPNREKFIEAGFDSAIDFQPRLHTGFPKARLNPINWFFYRIRTKILNILGRKSPIETNLIRYKEYIDIEISREPKPYKEFPGITPSWDNSPRRINKPFWAIIENTPELYGQWLKHILKSFVPYSREENLIFINAWNEWAEGNHLEPDQKWGRAYLNETRKVISEFQTIE
ncbi:glycoside hydrolase family 99-like domain-containing protein [Prevotella sp. E9-3]|uniref:glycosyltransferase WbsX family protein n=1 Tax=Prevotella sp. E9-3 TaxID=2913621 RepID=UPI001EDAC14F|nr:glycoside hydrolase family 99-like domain-containing protein [Prevotella sp. E9-3]UKK47604.1 glycoside hydrolase family 99-like domain-containing protein [Prevotella sp. E9-3]